MSKVSDMFIAAEESQNNDERLAAWKERWRIYQKYQRMHEYNSETDPEWWKHMDEDKEYIDGNS